MKVKCIFNKGIYLPKDMFFDGSSCKETSSFALKINKEYTVYAITINDGYAWYFVCDENYTYHPNWQPCPLFEVTDNRLSSYWVFSYKNEINGGGTQTMWAFPAWANDPDYYYKLFESYEDELRIFRAYKEQRDLEFPDINVSEYAQIGDENWLICPNCYDAWQSKNLQNALVKCPTCLRIYNNPRYIKSIQEKGFLFFEDLYHK